jgi:hypothetical protein
MHNSHLARRFSFESRSRLTDIEEYPTCRETGITHDAERSRTPAAFRREIASKKARAVLL